MKVSVESIAATLLNVCLLVSSGCATTPIAEIEPGVAPAKNTDLAGLFYTADQHEEALKTAPNRIRDKKLNEHLRALVCELAGEYCESVRVYVLDMPYFNAYMLPNGAMAVWSGLLLRANSEDELAFVLSHEIGHYVKQHSLRRFREIKSASGVLTVLQIAAPYAGMFSQLATLGVLMRHNRADEIEADSYAITTLRENQRNASAGADLFSILLAEEGEDRKNKGVFLATHPTTQSRVDNIQSTLLTHRAKLKEDQYPALVAPFQIKWLAQEVGKRKYADTERLLLALKRQPNRAHSKINFALAELYRKRGAAEDLDKAISHYQKHINDKSTINVTAFKRLGELFMRKSLFSHAYGAYSAYLVHEPDAYDFDSINAKLSILKGKKDE